jgi:hypothetical protein
MNHTLLSVNIAAASARSGGTRVGPEASQPSAAFPISESTSVGLDTHDLVRFEAQPAWHTFYRVGFGDDSNDFLTQTITYI